MYAISLFIIEQILIIKIMTKNIARKNLIIFSIAFILKFVMKSCIHIRFGNRKIIKNMRTKFKNQTSERTSVLPKNIVMA